MNNEKINEPCATYNKFAPIWKKIENVCNGDNVEQYLVLQNAGDLSERNRAAQEEYKRRAVFYGVAGYTVSGLCGLIFTKDPVLEAPEQLAYLSGNCDGGGVGLQQQSQQLTDELIKKSRAALYVSFPSVAERLTVSDISSGKYVPKINLITAENIINWETSSVGAVAALSRVVISEGEDNYRELLIDDAGEFVVNLWRADGSKAHVLLSQSSPRDFSGAPLRHIPFYFAGGKYNSPAVQPPHMRNLCDITIALYRNSAEYEDSVWWSGQNQPWMSGITMTDVDAMRERKIRIGSKELIAVPPGEQFGFASPAPNPLVRQAMLDKIQMLIGLGARFISDAGPAKTATEAAGQLAASTSILSTIATNVGDVYTKALGACLLFAGAAGPAKYSVNSEFVERQYTSDDAQKMAAMFIQGALPMGTYLAWLKKAGLEAADTDIETFGAMLDGSSQ